MTRDGWTTRAGPGTAAARRRWLKGMASLGVAHVTGLNAWTPARAAPALPAFYGGWTRDSERYEIERQARVWQARKPQRRPELIVSAGSVGEIRDALRYAAARDLTVAVRGSGHNYYATYLRDGGMLLDVSGLRGVTLEGDRAWLGPGLRAAEIVAELAPGGHAFPVAHASTVGLGGYLLGGGMGWNGEDWGQFACFNIEAVEVLTAAGELVMASANSHPDLYWAARGAGPAFPGVATRFRVRLARQPDVILAHLYAFPHEAAPMLARWLDGLTRQDLRHVELTLVLETAIDPSTGGARPQSFVSATAFGPTASGARSALERIAASAPRADALWHQEYRPLTFTDLFAAANTAEPRRVTADNLWTDRPVETIETLTPHFATVPSPHTVIINNFRRRAPLPADAACSVQGAAYVMWLCGWDRPEDDDANERWSDAATAISAKYAVGRYVNETDVLRCPAHARQSFSAAAWERLKRVRAHYDPQERLPSPFPI